MNNTCYPKRTHQAEAEMEEYSAIADAINEANSLAEKTTASHNTRNSLAGGGSAGSKRGNNAAAGASRSNRSGGDSDAEGRQSGTSAGSRRVSRAGGGGRSARKSGSPSVKSRAPSGGGGGGGGGGVVAGGGGGQSVGSKDSAGSYTVARHVADFGNVVVGFTKTKAFRVANTGKLGPVSWSFNKNSLAGSGYSIEPEKVVRLPEGASAAFSASFQAR